MMLVADPFISLEGTNKLGRQLAQLFRQDFQVIIVIVQRITIQHMNLFSV